MRSANTLVAAGPLLSIIVYNWLPGSYALGNGSEAELAAAARATVAVGSWMALWWLTEAVPLAATALLPLVVFPLLGVRPLAAVAPAYAHPLIFLFFGGFIVSLAIEKWQLHAWMAARVTGAAAGNRRLLVAGFMAVAAFCSMWLSNTATTVMMLPVALAALTTLEADDADDNLARCLLLGVAYGASIGGTATLVGSPPNLFVASFLGEQYGIDIDFRRWMLLAFPVALLLLPLTWLLLTRVVAPVSGPVARHAPHGATRWRELGPGARRVAVVFALAVAAWLTRTQLNAVEIAGARPLAALTDTGVAMLAALSLFVLPAGDGRSRLLTWGDTASLPYGTLILFGGGLALAGAVSASGADRFLGAQLAGLDELSPLWVVVAIVASVVFLTELTSNIATTTTLAPVLAAAALALGLDLEAVVVVTALAASCAFMMPVATPPNAIVFASGRIPVAVMARAGLTINLVAIVVIALVAHYWLPRFTSG